MFTGELVAALSLRQGHTGGIIASTEGKLPAGFFVTISQLRLSCSRGYAQHNTVTKTKLYTGNSAAQHRSTLKQVNWFVGH